MKRNKKGVQNKKFETFFVVTILMLNGTIFREARRTLLKLLGIF